MAIIDSLKLNAKAPPPEVRQQLVSADVSMTSSQVSQLTLKFVDDSYSLLRSTAAAINIGSYVDLPNLPLSVAAIDTADVNGLAGFSLDCRPRAVRYLKSQQGARVMSNASATDFIKSECAKVKIPVLAQPCAKRKQVARDIPQPGSQETTDPPSTWSTMSRLANEEGFIVFEAAGVIYFGQPTWLVAQSPFNVFLDWRGAENDDWKAMDLPECHKSFDSPTITVQGKLPNNKAQSIICGRRLILQNLVPLFNGNNYMITSVSYDAMSDVEPVSVSASTPLNPKAQPPTS